MAVSAVVEEDGEGVAIFVEPRTTDDAQVLKGEIVELIQSHQHVTCHLTDGLERKVTRKKGISFTRLHIMSASGQNLCLFKWNKHENLHENLPFQCKSYALNLQC